MLRDTVAPGLRTFGFKGSGSKFSWPDDEYDAGLQFQKSVHSTREKVLFTVNLWAFNPIARAEQSAAKEQARIISNDAVVVPNGGFWDCRLWELMPEGEASWWSITSTDDPTSKGTFVLSAIESFGLPPMKKEIAKPLKSPTYTIQSRGDPSGRTLGPDGTTVWYNVGGVQLWP